MKYHLINVCIRGQEILVSNINIIYFHFIYFREVINFVK